MFIIDFSLIDYIGGIVVDKIKSDDYDKDDWYSHKKAIFRMLDDDDNIYYYGRLLCDEAWEYRLFEPLDDFGEPMTGCTAIEYYNEDIDMWERI